MTLALKERSLTAGPPIVRFGSGTADLIRQRSARRGHSTTQDTSLTIDHHAELLTKPHTFFADAKNLRDTPLTKYQPLAEHLAVQSASEASWFLRGQLGRSG